MIKEINYSETYPIRHRVMWPNETIDYIKLEDDILGKHYGYFLDNKLIAVISVFINKHEAQIRKFACEKTLQGNGYGSELMKFAIDQLEVNKIWLNARIEKTKFYEKFGFEKTTEEFTKKHKHYVIMTLKKAVQ